MFQNKYSQLIEFAKFMEKSMMTLHACHNCYKKRRTHLNQLREIYLI